MIIIQNTKFYTVLEVAKELNITPLTVRTYIRPVSYTHLTLPTNREV